MSDSWAMLRQVVIATATLADDVGVMRTAYSLPPGFSDPVLLDYGVADETIPIGPKHFVEFIAPADETSFLHPWLDRCGGHGGYCLSVQVPDVAAIRDRTSGLGIRIVTDQQALGHQIMQVRSRDVPILLDLGEIPDRSRWFWDDITPGPAAAATVDGIVEVEFGVTDAEAAASLWSVLLGVDQPTPTSVDLGTIIRFVTSESRGLTAVTLTLADGVAARNDANVAGLTVRHRVA